MTTADVLAEVRMAKALGRPIRRCPSCGKVGAAHYIPDRLDDNDLLQAGRFTCEAPAHSPHPSTELTFPEETT